MTDKALINLKPVAKGVRWVQSSMEPPHQPKPGNVAQK